MKSSFPDANTAPSASDLCLHSWGTRGERPVWLAGTQHAGHRVTALHFVLLFTFFMSPQGGRKKRDQSFIFQKKIMQSPVLQMGLAEQALVLRGRTGSWARDVPNGFAWSPALLQPCSGKGNGIECSRNALL